MSIAETLALVNEHRVNQGMKPLKSWKDSKAKLDAMLAKLTDNTPDPRPEPVVTKAEPAVAEGAYKNKRQAKERTGIHARKSQPGIHTQEKPAKQQHTPTGDATSQASLAARELSMNPKNVRARLRKLGHNAGHGLSAAEIVKLLTK